MSADSAAEFVPGHQLSAALYRRYVRVVLARDMPRLSYGAALIGHGSDVLGYDTARSVDHDWGPRLQIIIEESQRAVLTAPILRAVESDLPDTVLGVSTDIAGATHLPGAKVTHHNSPGTSRNHGITVTSINQLSDVLLGTSDPPQRWTAARWLTTPQQSLLEFTSGPVHRDDSGDLSAVRAGLAWYPHDLWLYVMSGRWQRIAQVEAFVGRTGELGDDLGSRVLAASIVRDVMHLALLQRRRYVPYAKWLGTAFSRCEANVTLTLPLGLALSATTWPERQDALVAALLELSRRHGELGVTAAVDARAESFFSRPYRVIWSERHARALHSAIGDPEVGTLPYGMGGINEITDSTDFLKNPLLREHLGHALRAPHSP